MEAIILYAAKSKLTTNHHPVTIADNEIVVYVRAERVHTEGDLSDALSKAFPLHEETVLNSIAA